MVLTDKKVDFLIADTTAFIENAPLQDIANHVVTVQEVLNEISNKRQLRRLVVLPYDLVVKDVFSENIHTITEFAKKTGDYLNLSATDIKVMALAYQFEKEYVGIEHLRKEPIIKSTLNIMSKPCTGSASTNISGFFMPKYENKEDTSEPKNLPENSHLSDDHKLIKEIESLKVKEKPNILPREIYSSECCSEGSGSDDDNDSGWITPATLWEAKKQISDAYVEEKFVKVACITTDFAMQNVLKQMNLHVSALDGKIIKQLKTYILRCYTCFKTTSIMTKKFCPKCGNNTLKRVSVSVDENGKQNIHINARHPLTARGKKFSLPTVQGGKHSNNPILASDQPMPDQRPTRLARTKNNPLDDDYIAGFSPFIMRDVNSKSAQLGIRPDKEVKHWMQRNPNEARKAKR